MNKNFENKIIKIEKLLSHWSYRYLTPYGKVTIIKSLALSKLSHVALVIPNPTKIMFKKIETIFYKFLWNGKSEKVCRADTKLPEKLGGLGMPDIEQFWLSFKFSWLRRLLMTDAFWHTILLHQISKIQGQNLAPSQLLEFGPCLLGKIGKSLKNIFWNQVLQSTIKIYEGAAFCNPELILQNSFFYNPLILRNKKTVRYEDFPELKNRISTIANFFHPGTNVLMSFGAFKDSFGVEIDEVKYIDIRYIIKLAFQKLRLSESRLSKVFYPSIPTLINIALSTKKGCGAYYKILSRKRCVENKIAIRDEKWHIELQSVYSLIYWEKIRALNATIDIDNPCKWLQYQIIRNSLQTNYIVSHFIRNKSPLCQYCTLSNEKISHLYWFCSYVKNFLTNAFQYITNTGLIYAPTKLEFLFGVTNETFDHPINYLSLLIKKYIWKIKFKNAILNIVGLKNHLKLYLRDLKNIYEKKEKASKFIAWIPLYSDLCQVDQNAEHDVQAQTAPVRAVLVHAAAPQHQDPRVPPA